MSPLPGSFVNEGEQEDNFYLCTFQVGYCGKRCQKNHWKVHRKLCRNFVITTVGHKGQGVVASRAIKPGELICRERAAIVLAADAITEDNLRAKYEHLSADQKKHFGSLTAKSSACTHSDIFINNAINIEADNYGVFLTIARVNHSCDPNAGGYKANAELTNINQ